MHLVLAAATTLPTTFPAPAPHGTPAERMQSFLGLLVFTAIAFGIGRMRGSRAKLPVRTILWGFVLQFAFGAIVLFAPAILEKVKLAIQKLLDFSDAGATMVFGVNMVKGTADVTTGNSSTIL